MAITNQERVGKAMELLRAGLAPFVEREFKSLHQTEAAEAARRYFGDDRTLGRKPVAECKIGADTIIVTIRAVRGHDRACYGSPKPVHPATRIL